MMLLGRYFKNVKCNQKCAVERVTKELLVPFQGLLVNPDPEATGILVRAAGLRPGGTAEAAVST